MLLLTLNIHLNNEKITANKSQQANPKLYWIFI